MNTRLGRLLGMTCALGLAACCAACSVSWDCSSTMSAFYDKSCYLAPDGTQLTETQAVAWCKTTTGQAGTCGCDGEADGYLSCLGNATQGNCAGCATQLADLELCTILCSCENLMAHYYTAINCSITSGGSPLTLEDAVRWCNEAEPRAQTCGCVTQMDSLEDCLARSGYAECDNCGAQFEAYNTCFNACGG